MTSGVDACSACGRPSAPDDVFCGGCGVQLRDQGQASTLAFSSDGGSQADRCGSCNSPVATDLAFCTSCGAPRPSTDTGLRLAPTRDLEERLQNAARGEYQILAHLGRGGMGSVFLGLDLSLHRHVAIKVMAPGLLQDANMLERFRTEARIVATLRHPGIVNIHGFRSVDDLHFFIMDFVEGATLRQVIRSRGPLPVDVVRAVLYDVGSALHHAHVRAGVVHRDVKPSNIILDSAGHAVVMDFGISKAANTRAGLTMTGVVVGTPEYMSPEQCRGGDVTPASDQYSLGLVGYTMLTGSPPFSGQHWSVLQQQTSTPAPAVRSVRPDCPVDVAEAIDRMLSKAPRDRFPDTLSAVRALGGGRYEEGDPIREMVVELVGREHASSARAAPVAGIALDGVPDRVEPGDVLPITAVALDALGRPLPDRAVVVESTDPSIVEVTSSGTLRAVREGSIRLVARAEGIETARPLVVSPVAVASVEIDPLDRPVLRGARRKLRASARDGEGRELTGRSIVWASSDPEVVEVSRTGEIRVHAAGKATVLATCEGRSRGLDLEVPEGPVEEAARPEPQRVSARPAPAPRPLPGTGRKRRVALATAAVVVIAGGAAGGGWMYLNSSAGGGDLGGPLGDGAPGAGDPGSEPGPPSPRVASNLTILSGGSAVAGAFRLYVGDTIDLDAALSDSLGVPMAETIDWTASDPAVISVGGDGRVAALRAGTTAVTAVGAGLTRRVEVVVEVPTLRVAVTTGTGGSVAAGVDLDMDATLDLRATVLDVGGRAVSGRDLSWTSTNPSVVSVTNDGRLRGVGPGSATVRVAAADLSQAVQVRVRAVVAELAIVRALSGVPVEDRVQIDGGATLGLSAVPYASGRRRIEGLTASWSSSDPSVASIDEQGVITARRAGQTLVLVRVGDVVGDVTVEVTAPPPGTLVLTVRPYAYVTIDGARRDGEQRRLELSVPAGSHTLRLEHPTLGTFDTTFVVESNRTTSVDKLLGPGGE